MQVLFMGTPEFAAVSLLKLINSGHELIGVVTQPDRPKGRGMELQASEVKRLALQSNLPLWQPEKVATPDFLKIFRELKPELVIVVAFGQKIPAEILFEPKFGCINVHGSLLPEYRGAAPIQWSVLNGDERTGVTTMFMDEGWDTGDIIFQEETDIDPDENFLELYQRLAQIGGDLLIKTVNTLEEGVAPRVPQQNELATFAPRLKPELQKLNWAEPAGVIHNKTRVFAPSPGVETNLNQERLKIIETKIPDSFSENGEPGQIIQIVKNMGILVATGDKPIIITKIQPAGKKVMSAWEFSNGRRLKTGMSFAECV